MVSYLKLSLPDMRVLSLPLLLSPFYQSFSFFVLTDFLSAGLRFHFVQ